MIDVYSTRCPKCKILIKRLEQNGIEFNLIEHLSDIYEVAERYDIKEAPFVVKDKSEVYNFTEAMTAITEGRF